MKSSETKQEQFQFENIINSEIKSNSRNPASIERASMEIITRELSQRGVIFHDELQAAVVKRVIHATADFDFAENIKFTPDAANLAVRIIRNGGSVWITDTHMALAGLNQACLRDFNAESICLMADPEVRERARRLNLTRAAVAVDYALEKYEKYDKYAQFTQDTRSGQSNMIFAVGNAPTALLRLSERISNGFRPAIVIAMPVGFVNVIESKKKIWHICQRCEIPAIVSMGRKGGSGAAVAVCNALIYAAAGLSDPETRN